MLHWSKAVAVKELAMQIDSAGFVCLNVAAPSVWHGLEVGDKYCEANKSSLQVISLWQSVASAKRRPFPFE